MSKDFNPGEDLSQISYTGARDGVFIAKQTIVSAKIGYNVKVASSWSPSSIILKLELSQTGRSFNVELKLFGDYVVSDGKIQNKGTTWRVFDPLGKLAAKHKTFSITYNADGQILCDNKVVDGDFPELVGCDLWTVSYPGYKKKDDGSAGYSTWNRVFIQFDTNTDAQMKKIVRESFFKQVAAGWEKNYQPWLMESFDVPEELLKARDAIGRDLSGTNAPWLQIAAKYSDNVTALPESGGSETDAFDPDDDLPF